MTDTDIQRFEDEGGAAAVTDNYPGAEMTTISLLPHLCRNCKHWDEGDKTSSAYVENVGTCRHISDKDSRSKAGVSASYCDDEPELITEGDFGCTEWSAKDA